MPDSSGALGRFDLHRAVVRTAFSLVLAAAVGVVLWSVRAPPMLAALACWDAGALLFVALSWSNMISTTPSETRVHAAAEDPGRTAVYFLVLLASSVSLFSSTVLIRGVKAAPPFEAHALLALCLLAVAVSWTLTHTAFALRYAHLYYREDEDGTGGIEFPGGEEPEYFDFAYFAFTIGMCFQVADTSISGRIIRRAVLLQATMSFVYNTVILAFVLNLAFGLA